MEAEAVDGSAKISIIVNSYVSVKVISLAVAAVVPQKRARDRRSPIIIHFLTISPPLVVWKMTVL